MSNRRSSERKAMRGFLNIPFERAYGRPGALVLLGLAMAFAAPFSDANAALESSGQESNTQALAVHAGLADKHFIAPDEPIELILNRQLTQGEGRLAVVIGATDLTDLFVVSARSLKYDVGRSFPLPLGATQLTIYLVPPNNDWKELARFPQAICLAARSTSRAARFSCQSAGVAMQRDFPNSENATLERRSAVILHAPRALAALSATNDQTHTGMERNALIEESLARAFQLAYFIHGDRETALNIATEALAKLEVAAAAQDKRLYYTPTGRAERAERFRTKVSVGEMHLLQRLVYVESEPYERRDEQASNGKSSDEEDMLIYFIKHLVRITTRRNSFYVTLGLSRLLHNYSTAETMEMYNVLVQDPGRVRDDYYYRSRKGRLMKELKERFGDRIRVTRGARGEERFHTDDAPGRHAELVRECLQEFTPWNTSCSIPADLDPGAEEIQGLAFDGSDPDREHSIEVNRFHAALHPDCFARIAASLNFVSPVERLTTPYFSMSRDRNQDQDRKPPRRSRRAPQLDKDEMNAVKSLLAERSSRRKTAAAGLLRIIVDGSERASLDLNRASRARVETNENDEMIEVRSADGLLLATYLLNNDDLSEAASHERSSIVLESGQRISFARVEKADGETSGATIDISYRETWLSRAAALYLRRAGFIVRDLRHRPETAAWKPALSFAALLIIALGLIYYWRGQDRAKQDDLVEKKPVRTIESPAPPAPAPDFSPARRDEKKQPAPAPRTTPDDPEKLLDALRSERLAPHGASLLAIKRVHVDPFSDDPIGKQFRDDLISALRANRRFSLTTNRDEADAVLKGKITAMRPEQTSATVRLVNARGEVVWPPNGPITGKLYQGPVATIASQIARDLLADMDKAERK